MEGALLTNLGLTEEQISETKLDPNLYEEYGYKGSYELTTGDDGKSIYTKLIPLDDAVGGAVTATRMCVGLQLNGNTDDYTIEQGESAVLKHAYELWTKYEDTGSASDYASLLNSDDSQTWSTMQTTVRDYMSQNLPQVIRGEKTWDEYVAGMEVNDPSSVCELLQKQIDKAK